MAIQKTRFLDAISSDELQTASEKLPVVLGNNAEGQLVLKDLAQLQHMIIAGASGSGKSSLAHEIILSLACKLSPDKVRFLLCDTKTVEFLDYKEIPHLLSPPSSNMDQIVGEILWTHGESLRRLKLFAECGVNNVDAYNDFAWEGFEEELPHIILVVDDAAQVLTEDGIADLIQQLCQNGRTVGIHVILVTQNPGLKKLAEIARYHIPARAVCSRLNQTEENWLLGRKHREPLSNIGEFYFYDFFTHICVQLCSFNMAYVPTWKLVEQILLKYPPDQYNKQYALEGRTPSPSNKDTPVDLDCDDELENLDGDEMLPQAVDVILETGQASVSMLQRRLKLGYARAARLVDEMEMKGIVGPFMGSKPRAILISKDYWHSIHPENCCEQNLIDNEFSPAHAKDEDGLMQKQQPTFSSTCGVKIGTGAVAPASENKCPINCPTTEKAVPSEKIEPVCPYCGSRNIVAQVHQEVQGSKNVTKRSSKYHQQRHDSLWWCVIGWRWMVDLMRQICYFPLRFMVQLLKGNDCTEKPISIANTRNGIACRTVFLCKNCSNHWKEEK